MRDPVDEQIRALVARAVREAPPPPEVAEVAAAPAPSSSTPSSSEAAGRRWLRVEAGSPNGSGPGSGSGARTGHRPARRGRASGAVPSPGGRRPVVAAVAAVAAVAVGIVGALAVDRQGDDVDLQDHGAGSPAFTANGVRYVPTPASGMQVTGIEDHVSAPGSGAATPTPAVTVFQGDDDVLVRIVRGSSPASPSSTVPPGGAGTATTTTTPASTTDTTWPSGSPTGGTPTSTATSLPTQAGVSPTSPAPATSVPRSSLAMPARGTAPTTTVVASPVGTDPPTTVAPPDGETIPDTTNPTTEATTPTTTTTIPASGQGLPSRPAMEQATVRGGPGAVEHHGPEATTAWFVDQGRVVAVDVFGLDAAAALVLVEDLVARSDGGFVPAEPMDVVAHVPDGSPGDQRPATTRVEYQVPDNASLALAVTTTGLDSSRPDLLSATAPQPGELARWGDHEVLVDDQVAAAEDDDLAVRASFVDTAADVLVTVDAWSVEEARVAVEGLQPLDVPAWQHWLRSAAEAVAQRSPATSVSLGDGVTITEHEPASPEPNDGRGGHCLHLAETNPVCRPAGGIGTRPDGVGHQVLVAGNWWYFGYVSGSVAAITVVPDRGAQPEALVAGEDGRTWFAVRLPPDATTAEVHVVLEPAGSIELPPSTYDIRRPAS